MQNNYASEYQKALEKVRATRCLNCNGLGFRAARSTVFVNQTYFKEVRCNICRGTGLQPVKKQGAKKRTIKKSGKKS